MRTETCGDILFRKGILMPADLAPKMAEVEARWPVDRADANIGSEPHQKPVAVLIEEAARHAADRH